VTTRLKKVGLACIREGRLLLCRTASFADLITPGGVIEPGESSETCLRREVEEELGPEAELVSSSLTEIGRFEDVAAGSPGVRVEIELWVGELRGQLLASSEITDLIWFAPEDDNETLSPIVRNKILPELRRQGLI
jgi:8-oxo-dGTP diphosphatase